MMGTKSQRNNNVTGARGELLATLLFPAHWVVRKLERDHGIDLDVEVFRRVENEERYETTGQHLYVQVKASRTPLKSERFAGHDVLALNGIETSLLRTVTAMGVASPVILLHIDITNGLAHWVCLNDYIDKYLFPSSPNALTGKSRKIYFNPHSIVDQAHEGFWQIEALSQRARMVSMFYLLESLHREMQRLSREWQAAATRLLPEDFRSTSGLNGLNGLVRQILAMKPERRTEFGGDFGVFWPGSSRVTATLSAIDDAITSFYLGNDTPNAVLRDSCHTFKDDEEPAQLVKDLATYEAHTLLDFLRNVEILIESVAKVAAGFETISRWVGMPFPRPANAQEAQILYAAVRASARP